jgi:putative oligomerization/nucleic acid binding protein
MPSGAAVFVDGKPVGVTPLVLTTNDLMPRRAFDGKPSTHAMLVIEMPGYSSYQLVLGEFALPNEVNAELRPNISGAPSSSDPALSPDVVREIERLQQLREKGAISEEEFQQLKKKALDRASAAPPP